MITPSAASTLTNEQPVTASMSSIEDQFGSGESPSNDSVTAHAIETLSLTTIQSTTVQGSTHS